MRTIWDFYGENGEPLASCVVNLPDDIQQLKVIINLPALIEKHSHKWQSVWLNADLPGYRCSVCGFEAVDLDDAEMDYWGIEKEAAKALAGPEQLPLWPEPADQISWMTDPEGFAKAMNAGMQKAAELIIGSLENMQLALAKLHEINRKGAKDENEE